MSTPGPMFLSHADGRVSDANGWKRASRGLGISKRSADAGSGPRRMGRRVR
jgi:hypothetical protein